MDTVSVLRWITIVLLGAGTGALLMSLFALGKLVCARTRTSSSVRFTQWLMRKWQRQIDPGLLQDYQVTFSTPHGQRVLQHLMDQAYCTVYEGKDPLEMAGHNGRRSVVQEILENMDIAASPEKYRVRTEGE